MQPESSTLRLALAGILERNGDYDGAISEYETMLRSEPNSLIVANNLASLLADRRTDKASLERAQSLAAVLNKSPIPQFKDTLGWVSYLRGDYDAAIPLLRVFQKVDGAKYVGPRRLHGVVLIVDRRGRTRQVVNLVGFNRQRRSDILRD